MIALAALLPCLAMAQVQAPAAASPAWTAQADATGVVFIAEVSGSKTQLGAVKLGALHDVLRRGDFVYAALAAGGIVVIDAQNPRAPRVVGMVGEGQVALHLAISGNELAALLGGQSVVLYDLSDPAHPVSAQSATAESQAPVVLTPAPAPSRATVLAAKDGAVVINGGTNQGFAQGQNIAIYSHTRMSEKDTVAQAAGMETPGLLVAIVRLERVQADRSLATYGRGDDPQKGDTAITTSEPTTANLAGPRWVPFNWRFGLEVQPFLGTGGDGHPIGLIGQAFIDYYMTDVPLRLEVAVQPFGFVTGTVAQHNPIGVDATLAFYSRFFEIGIGGGVATTAQPCFPLEICGNETVGTLDQTLRLGALDGVNFIWHSSIGYGQTSFIVSVAQGSLNFPLGTRLTLFFDGGGGTGFALFDGGLRTYLGGVGGPGTVILSAGLGFAGVTDNASNNVLGPALVFGIEARL